LNRSAAAFLLLAAAARPVAAQSAGDAMSLLGKTAAAYRSGAAETAAFTQIYTPAGFTTSRRESGTIWVQAPDRLRFDYTAPDPKVFTYDGGEGRFLLPADRQLTIRKISPDERARLPIVFLQKPEELSRRYEVSLEAPGVVRLEPRDAGSDLAWLKLTIDGSGRVSDLAYADTSGNRTEFRFEDWKTEKPRPPSDYRVTGPRGTRVIED
jgi:outer membrane lipoprotein-sorting protein